MPHFIIDAGYFVGRMEKHWSKYSKQKNMRYWQNEFNESRISAEERTSRIKKIFNYDLGYIQMRMEEMGEIESIIVCYDGIYGRRNRGKLYPKYKMNRSDIPAHEHKGIDIRKRIRKCGFDPNSLFNCSNSLYEEYKEADDLLIEQANLLLLQNKEVVVMSKDSDLYQIVGVNDDLQLHDFTRIIDETVIEEELGILPSQYLYFKCLVGDKSDNIPGVKGIGEAKARKILKEYPTIEDLPSDYFTQEVWDDIGIWYRLIKLPFNEN
jgi:5'-3' exonuclease